MAISQHSSTASDQVHSSVTQGEIVARLERLPISPWHIRARVIIGLATFFDGFDVQAMGLTLPVLAEIWKIAPAQLGLMLSSGFAGQLVGALLAGWMAERYGRLRVAGATIAMFGTMSLLCALSWNPHSMMVFRFLQGIGLGGEVPIAAAYMSELIESKRRGRFFALYELIFPLGLLGTSLGGYWIVPRFGWRSMFYIGAAPALLTIFLRRLLPESPRWLASKGRLVEADAAVRRIEQAIVASGRTLPLVEKSELAELAPPQSSSWLEIFQGIYLRRTLVVWCLWFSCYIVTYSLLSWLPTLYRTMYHLSLSRALEYGLITQAFGFAGSIAGALLIDRVGRRFCFVFAFSCASVSLFALSLFGAASAKIVLIFSSTGFFFIASLSLLVYLYTTEIYPTRMRAFGCGLASAWLRLAATIGPIVVGAVLPAYGIRPLFAMFAGFALLGAIVAIWGGIETTGRLLEELSP